MRLRAYGTDFYAVQLQKEREKHKSYLLPVPRVPPCRPEAAEKEVISAIISSCDNLLQLQVSGRHLTGHLDVNEREAADSLAESFEKILIEDGRCTVETDASAKDLHSVVQTAAYGATSPVQDGRVFELDSQQSYWSTFRTLEDAEAAVFEADPIQNLEESEFFDQSELQVSILV